MPHKNILKILFIEDLPTDVELEIRELHKEKLTFEHTTVCTREDLIKALKEFNPDLIISDYMMPLFNGLQALKVVKEFNPEIPVILCTGSINEETAVECIKAGAEDYVIKEHITRLPFVVKEVLEQMIIRKESRVSELLLKETEEKLQSIFSAAPVGIGLVVNRVLIEVNDTFCKMTGYTRKELIGKSSELIYATKEEYESAGIEKYKQISEKGIGSVETRFKCKNGKILNIILSSAPLNNDDLTRGVTFTAIDITDRIQAEEALANEKYLIYSLMNTLPDHIYFKDLSSRFIRINEALSQFFGLSDPRQAIGKTDSDFFTADHAQQTYKDEQKIIQTGQSLSIEERETHPDGTDTWVSTVKMPLLDKDGNIIGTFGISRDITKRKITEEALHESQHLFQTLAQVSPVGIFRTDRDGNTTYVNPKWLELSGLTFEEAAGINWLNAVHPDDKEKLKEGWLSDFASQRISSAEYRFLRSDGSIVWVMGNAVPELIDNKIMGYIGTITDITERKRSEEALRESEERFRSIMENSADAIFITDQQGRYIYANKAVTNLLGFTQEEIISKTILDLTPKNKTDKYLEIFKKVMDEGKVFTEIELLKKDGNFISTDLNSVLLPGGLVYGSCRDITERKLAENAMKHARERAEASDKLKTAFLNNISHEVRTPLNGILGFAEIMSQSGLSEKEKKDSLSMLFESSDRLLNTITNYMDISLITSGSLSVHKKDFHPGQVLRRIFDSYKTICSDRNLELFLEIPEQSDTIFVNSDTEIFRKIISHLLDNAIKFTEKGSIRYGYAIHRNELEFFVKDTGIGIGEESLETVFDSFAKANRGQISISEGSGLGLSIAKGMTEFIEGKIRVESELGAGSCFYFTIPSIKDSGIPLADTVAKDHKKTTSGASILVAEDDETNFFFLQSLLTRETGASVLHASTGREAIELFKANPGIILILMDIKMPVMDGLEATRQIKAINRNVPIIAITAYAMSGDEERVLAAGCDSYLAKPVDKKVLLKKIAEFIEI